MSKLEELYYGLELSADAYLQNSLNMTKFGTNYAFSKLREKVNIHMHLTKIFEFLIVFRDLSHKEENYKCT